MARKTTKQRGKKAAEEKLYEYDVTVQRTVFEETIVRVRAANKDDAEDEAMDHVDENEKRLPWKRVVDDEEETELECVEIEKAVGPAPAPQLATVTPLRLVR